MHGDRSERGDCLSGSRPVQLRRSGARRRGGGGPAGLNTATAGAYQLSALSGSDWADEDAVLRFGVELDQREVQFQPGTWLVRAGAMKDLLSKRGEAPVEPKPEPGAEDSDSEASEEQETGGPHWPR